jgi:hypothetical protein
MRDRSPLTWRRSSYSSSGGNCVEVARAGAGRLVFRDSKAPEAGMIGVPAVDLSAMIRTLTSD